LLRSVRVTLAPDVVVCCCCKLLFRTHTSGCTGSIYCKVAAWAV
jgi:hypothetical protein